MKDPLTTQRRPLSRASMPLPDLRQATPEPQPLGPVRAQAGKGVARRRRVRLDATAVRAVGGHAGNRGRLAAAPSGCRLSGRCRSGRPRPPRRRTASPRHSRRSSIPVGEAAEVADEAGDHRRAWTSAGSILSTLPLPRASAWKIFRAATSTRLTIATFEERPRSPAPGTCSRPRAGRGTSTSWVNILPWSARRPCPRAVLLPPPPDLSAAEAGHRMPSTSAAASSSSGYPSYGRSRGWSQRQGEQQGDVDQGGPDAAGSGGRPLGERQACAAGRPPGPSGRIPPFGRSCSSARLPDPGPTLDVLPARHHRGGIVGPLERPPRTSRSGRPIPTTLAAGFAR